MVRLAVILIVSSKCQKHLYLFNIVMNEQKYFQRLKDDLRCFCEKHSIGVLWMSFTFTEICLLPTALIVLYFIFGEGFEFGGVHWIWDSEDYCFKWKLKALVGLCYKHVLFVTDTSLFLKEASLLSNATFCFIWNMIQCNFYV